MCYTGVKEKQKTGNAGQDQKPNPKNFKEELKMKTTNTTRKISTIGKVKRSFTVLLAGVMMTTTAASIAASSMIGANAVDLNAVAAMNTNTAVMSIKEDQYNGHDIMSGVYQRDGFNIDFRYSDGFFETDPKQYDPHIATMSCNLANASTTVENGSDFSQGPKTIKDLLTLMGFEDLYASPAYTQEPTPDSVACAIGSKDVETEQGTKKVISITVRSANYEKEWASNVSIGKEGEAEGFAAAANEVTAEVNQYLEDHGLTEEAENGNVIFWLSGFSRGGATANLTAKRLIDQFENGKIYAYTIEAPQGGMASEERSDRDYTVIHNIVCKDDPVPFVAPTDWGFKRYGVDHFIYNSDCWDSENLQKSVFVNNVADNDGHVGVTDERLELLKKEIDKLAGDRAEDYYPVTSLNLKEIGFHYEISILPPDFDWWLSIDNCGKTDPKDVINKFIMNLGTNITREQYVNGGLQDGARRIMTFLNTQGVSIDDVVEAFDLKDTLSGIAENMIWDYISDYIDQIKRTPWDIPAWLPPAPDIDYLIDALKESLNDNQKMHEIFNNYEGGVGQAVDDLLNFAGQGLKGFSSLNEILTFAYSIGDIYKNHATLQSICWLRTFDGWYAAQ